MKALPTKADAPSAARERPADRPAVRQLVVDEDAGGGQRLDNFLIRHCAGVPKSHLYQLIRSGQVRVNGGRCRADDRLESGDVVRVPPMRAGAAPIARSAAPGAVDGPRRGSGPVTPAPLGARPVPAADFTILLEDDALLVIDKPAGIAVHGGSGIAFGVIERLRAVRPQARFLELAHRLDRETSGILMIAKKRRALVDLHEQLRDRRTDKRYRAVVCGRWPLRSKTLRDPLSRYLTAEGERRVRVDEQGKDAVTRVTGLDHFTLPGGQVCTLVEAKIETGRTHQIRVHLAHSGFPIVGDDKYGDFELNRQLQRTGHRRMFLHAYSLDIHHPTEGTPLHLAAPLPDDFARLRGGAS